MFSTDRAPTCADRELRVVVLGDQVQGYAKHDLLVPAMLHAARGIGLTARAEWIGSSSLVEGVGLEELNRADAVIAPPQGASYCVSLDGVLLGVRHAREQRLPFLAICGGFQVAFLEFARNAMGLIDLVHADFHPEAADAGVVPSCERGGWLTVWLDPASRARKWYARSTAIEEFACTYGPRDDLIRECALHGLPAVGWTEDGQAVLLELADHPFYMLVAYLPQWSSSPLRPHPLLTALLATALAARRTALDCSAPR